MYLPRTRMNRGTKGILRTSASVLALVASGTSERASLGKEDTKRCTGTTPRPDLLRRCHLLPRTRANRAETALPSLRVLALANRVVEQRPRYIDSEGA